MAIRDGTAAIITNAPAPGLSSAHADRRNAIALTDAGHEALDRFDEVAAQASDDVLGVLSEDERTEFVRLMARLMGAPAD